MPPAAPVPPDEPPSPKPLGTTDVLPELLPELLSLWEAGYEIVQTVRKDTADASFFKKLTSSKSGSSDITLQNKITGYLFGH